MFLVSDARRAGAADLERYFTSRAIIAALAAGALATAGLIVLHSDARYLYDRLTSEALPLVLVSLVCGAGALVLLYRRSTRGTRPLAVGAVVAVLWGWGVAQFPYLLPESLTISQGAAPSDTLTMVLIVFGIAVAAGAAGARAPLHARAARHGHRERGATSERLSAAEFRALFDELRAWDWPRASRSAARSTTSAPDQVVAAAGLVRSGETVTLSLPLSTHARPDSPQPADYRMTMMPDEDIGLGERAVRQGLHRRRLPQRGPHVISTPSRTCHTRVASTAACPHSSVTDEGAGSGAIDLLEDGLIGRGVLLDIARLHGVPWLEAGMHVHGEDLEEAERRQGTTVRQGDILLLRTGHAATSPPIRRRRRAENPDCIRPRLVSSPRAALRHWGPTATTTRRPAPRRASTSRSTSSR